MMEKKDTFMIKFTKFGIDFISADHGGIRMAHSTTKGATENFNYFFSAESWAGTAKDIANVLKLVGLAETVMASSTMHFACEEGFENNGDAHKMWNEAIEIYCNGVAAWL